jgi:outer membrane protein assembly factor BamB
MRLRTVLAIAVVVAGLAGAAFVGFGAVGDSGGDLAERWVSDTDRGTLGNHHAPAAGRPRGTGMVYAPISGKSDTGQCGLVALAATDGTAQWEYEIPPANCTIHSVADPTLADFDGDSIQEVLAATTERTVAAYHPLTGEKEFRYNLTDYGYTRPVVADLAGNSTEEVITTDVKGAVFVLRPNGTAVWTRQLSSYTWGQPAVDDFDGDDESELIVGLGSGALQLFEGDGSTAWNLTKPFESSITWTTTGQADGDRATEIVVATTGGTVVAIDGAAGAVEWRKDLGDFAAVHALGDGDEDGASEVYATARDGILRSLRASDGLVEWTTTLTSADVQMMPPPSMGDVDGDGEPELVATTNDGIVSIVDPVSGEVRASYEREVGMFVHPTLADTDGDGKPEIYVIYADGRVIALSYDE